MIRQAFGCIALVVGVLFCHQLSAAEAKRTNVLLVVTDDQRWDTVSALGNPEIKTPAMDALVQRGFTFNNAYCQGAMTGAVCLPSRTMIMTGKSVWKIPAANEVVASQPSLGAIFNKAGYETLYVGKKGNSYVAGNEQFDKFIYDERRARDNKLPEVRAKSSQFHADKTIEWLSDRQKDKPFLVFFAPPIPHDPRSAPAEFAAQYPAGKVSLSKNFMAQHPFDNGDMNIRDEQLAPTPRTEAEMKQHLADYYATIANLDFQLGRVIESLKKSGQLDNTLIIFTSDQGLAVGGRHGLMGKQNLYEHVKPPLVIAGPGIPHGSSDALVYLYDLLPTLTDYLHLPTPKGIDGVSLLPIIEGKQKTVRDVLFGAYKDSQRMVRDDRWKLIEYFAKGKSHTQLFDLKNDPDELHNLVDDPQTAAERKRLEGKLAEQRKMFGDPIDFGKESPISDGEARRAIKRKP